MPSWPGGPRKFSDPAIETALTLRLVFRLPLRQTEGFLRSIFAVLQADLEVPDHTTLSRRSQQLGAAPIGAAPDDVLVAYLRRVLDASPFYGEGYRKAWAKLRVEGVRTSQERVRRLMREHALQAPQRAGRRRTTEPSPPRLLT